MMLHLLIEAAIIILELMQVKVNKQQLNVQLYSHLTLAFLVCACRALLKSRTLQAKGVLAELHHTMLTTGIACI